MTVNHSEKLSKDYLNLLNDEEDFNVIINVGESPKKTFRAHSNVLKYRSLYFRNELAKTSKDNKNIKTINLNHISTQQFDVILKYIYGGVVSIENQDTSFIFEHMLVAYEFLLEELANNLETYLINEKANWLNLHFTNIYQTCFQNHKLQVLQKWCNDIVIKYPNKIFDSEDFTSLQEDVLVSLIKRDDLQMEEGKIWNYVIKWGIAQNPNLPSDGSEKWTSENFLALKTILQNCLPHIRYFQISSDEIIDTLEPYQTILEKNLWKDIMKRAINPNMEISSIILPPRLPRSTEPFSTIINEAHAAEIATWVDRKTEAYSIKNNPYEFKLLCRGTRDGFTNDSFWKLCDKQANTIVIMKVKDTDEILGGYNSVAWDNKTIGWTNCKDSFIFSLKNGTIQSSILSRVKNPESAIYSGFDYGPIFGNGHDLCMRRNFNQNNQCSCRHGSYEKAITIRNESGVSWFSVSEYEIFQISKIIK